MPEEKPEETPIPTIDQAPEAVRRQVEHARSKKMLPTGPGAALPVAAIGELYAVRRATQLGFATPPEMVATPCTRELEQLRTDPRSPITPARYQQQHGLELRYEAMAKLEAQKSEAIIRQRRQQSSERQGERQQAQLDARVKARAAELVAEQQSKAHNRAKAKAQKELTNG